MSLLRKKRIFYILMLFIAVFGLFTFRILWIQSRSAIKEITAGGRTINEMAVRQREEGIELDPGRGNFVDRNGHSLTGEVIWVPVLFPVQKLPEDIVLQRMAKLLHTTSEQIEQKWSGLKKPYIWPELSKEEGIPLNLSQLESEQWSAKKVEGFEVLPYVSRYSNGRSGSQWLGYVSQRPDVIRKMQASNKQYRSIPLTMLVGASGLERTFDNFLRGNGSTRASYTVDGQGRPLPGIGTRVTTRDSRYYPLQIKTTIDQHIQQEIEELTEEANMEEGAIVVLDVNTGDVVSMVSRPFYNPRHIDIKGENWSNHAVKAAVPGSIFKTVIAAAALEEKLTTPKEVFHCSGHYDKYGLSCWKEGGHGDITLEDGFAKSCNIVFATLGERLTTSSIALTASKLGLGQKIGWHDTSFIDGESFWQIDQEEAGTVFRKDTNIDGGVRVQTALGQRDVMVSPLQAANLIVTLLHGGKITSPRLVSEVDFKDGMSMINFPVQTMSSPHGQISQRTAGTLLSWMREVVTNGTGTSLQRAKWSLAGKSGTAEILKGGKSLNNQWFIGYGPIEKPQYAVAVLVQNRPSGSPHQGVLLFRQTMNLLASQESSLYVEK